MKRAVSFIRDMYIRLPKETVRYVIAGVITTLLDFGTFTVLEKLGVSDNWANGISIGVAVLFAYLVNKLYVFKTHRGSFLELASEFLAFLGGRAFTAILEFWGYPLLLLLFVEYKSVAKAVTIVVVFILNYIISKLFVFRQKKADH